ncbi:MAG TPA: class I SAM-dependent methyltransferase [Thermoanaerobaculia bacterium]|nr:class I SAM-dependent methyltransferase [Thermoanaerobaculia bacterium]
MAWYKEWFGEEYLGMYSHRDEQEAEAHIDFVERVLGEPRPRAVLDLACGAGRHTAVLRRRGFRTLGVDLSLTLLSHAHRLPRVAGDMRCLPFKAGGFDWVLNFFTSFGYFETERENFQVLEEIVRVLAPCGRFLIDIMNTANTLRHLQPREVQRLNLREPEASNLQHEQVEPPGGKRAAAKPTGSGTRAPEGRTVEIERWYDAATKRINKRIRVQAAGAGGTPRAFLESVRAYQPEEVTIGLHWAGLEVTGLYGNFQGDPYGSDSERLILVGWKPA